VAWDARRRGSAQEGRKEREHPAAAATDAATNATTATATTSATATHERQRTEARASHPHIIHSRRRRRCTRNGLVSSTSTVAGLPTTTHALWANRRRIDLELESREQHAVLDHHRRVTAARHPERAQFGHPEAEGHAQECAQLVRGHLMLGGESVKIVAERLERGRRRGGDIAVASNQGCAAGRSASSHAACRRQKAIPPSPPPDAFGSHLTKSRSASLRPAPARPAQLEAEVVDDARTAMSSSSNGMACRAPHGIRGSRRSKA
jgi:hypothetical protein